MFGRVGTFMYRRRWYVVSVWIVAIVIAGALASQVGKVLGPGEFTIGGSESARATSLLDSKFHQSDQRTTLVVISSSRATTSDPSFRDTVSSIVRKIKADTALRVQYLDNPLVSHNRQLISKDGHAITVFLASNLKEADIESKIDPLRSVLRTPGFVVKVTGTPALNHDYAVQSQNDLQKGDSITIPILMIILLLVFGSVVAAGLPLLLAGFSIAVSLALVFIFGHFINSSVYVQNVVTVLGLGVSIDYSLFIVYRFREELVASNGDRERAVVRTMQTTGRAVFFSGITVAIGLSSLFLTGITFTMSMGLGGMLVPVSALLVAMTLLPAVLGLLGPAVNFRLFRWILKKVSGGRGQNINTRYAIKLRNESGLWHRLALTIMRHPLFTGGAALLVLLAVAFPVTRMQLAYGGLKNAPRDVESVSAFLYMQSHFPASPDPTQIVITGNSSVLTPRTEASLRSLENEIRTNPEVQSVIGPADFLPTGGSPSAAQLRQLQGRYLTPDSRTALISVIPRHEVGTKANETMVRNVRSVTHRYESGTMRGESMFVGGASADYLDWNDALYSKFPFVVAVVLVLTYVFLFFAFRSVFLPLKAVLLNLLSVGAAYGALELVFQQGVGSGLLAFSPEDGVAPWVPIFLFAFLFGLSMDYEVFLISRIRERWLSHGYNRESVAYGLEKTGRLISSAALIMVVAFSGFLIGHEIQLKEFGFGLLASVALDATLVRVILVPSIMELMGTWNWWVPSRLREWSRAGSSEGDALAPLQDETEIAGAI